VSDVNATPFHAGEQAAQARVGVREKIAGAGQRMIRDAMPAQHRELFEKLPTIVVGSLDAQRRPWASILAGRPGFIRTPDERTLRVAVRPDAADPLAGQLALGVPLGLLGIEPHTRRRNRMNGTVISLDERGFDVGVDQSFGNCPQYIQAREPQWRDAEGESNAQALGPMLNDAARRLVARADTLFIASAAAEARGHAGAQGVDVSHRGGLPGFVRLDAGAAGDACVLTLPDYRGNFMFNTLGNIVAHPFAGLLFVDHDSGDLLQLTAHAQVIWDGPELQSFDHAQRLLKLRIDAAWWRPAALPLRWGAPRFAPQLALAGDALP
jgi:predicted pyridoxine 5'-phosphate oxidase superfamily flavin-nucleotide-binding protein